MTSPFDDPEAFRRYVDAETRRLLALMAPPATVPPAYRRPLPAVPRCPVCAHEAHGEGPCGRMDLGHLAAGRHSCGCWPEIMQAPGQREMFVARRMLFLGREGRPMVREVFVRRIVPPSSVRFYDDRFRYLGRLPDGDAIRFVREQTARDLADLGLAFGNPLRAPGLPVFDRVAADYRAGRLPAWGDLLDDQRRREVSFSFHLDPRAGEEWRRLHEAMFGRIVPPPPPRRRSGDLVLLWFSLTFLVVVLALIAGHAFGVL